MTAEHKPSASAMSKERLRLWLKILKTRGWIENEVRRRLRDQFGSTLPRFDVMSALARYPDGLKMSQISGMLKTSNGNITGIVDRLTDDGLALRIAVPGDRRAYLVRLTDAGQASFAELATAHEGWVNDMLAGLEKSEVDALGKLLDGVNRHLEQRGGSGNAQ